MSDAATLRDMADRIDTLKAENANLQDIVNDLTADDVRYRFDSRVIALPGYPEKIARILARSGGATYQVIQHALWPDPDDLPLSDSVTVHICRLRKATRPHGVVIENRYGWGYRVDEASQAALRRLLNMPVKP